MLSFVKFSCNSLHKRIFEEFSNIYLFSHQNRGRWRHKIGYISKLCCPNRIFFTKRRRIDVRRGMPSFMSISARVQELFRKNRGGGGRKTPPRRLRVKYNKSTKSKPPVLIKSGRCHWSGKGWDGRLRPLGRRLSANAKTIRPISENYIHCQGRIVSRRYK